MTSGQETEQVYPYNPGAPTGLSTGEIVQNFMPLIWVCWFCSIPHDWIFVQSRSTILVYHIKINSKPAWRQSETTIKHWKDSVQKQAHIIDVNNKLIQTWRHQRQPVA